jgi:hypothetical protein
LRTPKCPLR